MSQTNRAPRPPADVVEARINAWRSLVDTGVQGMLSLQKQLHPDRDPREYVRRAIRRQAEDSHRANLKILARTCCYGK